MNFRSKLIDLFRKGPFLHLFFWDKPTPKVSNKRICQVCNAPIKRSHKYIYWVDGVQHRDCSNPELKPIEQLAI